MLPFAAYSAFLYLNNGISISQNIIFILLCGSTVDFIGFVAD